MVASLTWEVHLGGEVGEGHRRIDGGNLINDKDDHVVVTNRFQCTPIIKHEHLEFPQIQ